MKVWKNRHTLIYGTLPAIDRSPKLENVSIKDIVSLIALFQQEDYYKPMRVCNFWRNNYIEYDSNDDRNKILSIKEYLGVIKQYLKDIINISKNLIHRKFN